MGTDKDQGKVQDSQDSIVEEEGKVEESKKEPSNKTDGEIKETEKAKDKQPPADTTDYKELFLNQQITALKQ